MTINASDVIDRARRILLDESDVRWPLSEMRLWFNDALKEIALVKPTAISVSAVIDLAPGTYQTVPENMISVMRVVRNLKSSQESPRQGGRAVQVVDFDVMNAQFPNWHDEDSIPAVKNVINVVFDQANPRSFYVFPPNDGTGFVEAIVAKVPDGIPEPTSNLDDIESYAADIEIADIYSNVIVDYVLYRAYSKDASFAGSAQRAVAHYAQFSNALGVKLQNEMTRNVNVKVPSQQENAA
jgi:hypothetical protein